MARARGDENGIPWPALKSRAIVAEETAEFKSRDERQKALQGDAAADS